MHELGQRIGKQISLTPEWLRALISGNDFVPKSDILRTLSRIHGRDHIWRYHVEQLNKWRDVTTFIWSAYHKGTEPEKNAVIEGIVHELPGDEQNYLAEMIWYLQLSRVKPHSADPESAEAYIGFLAGILEHPEEREQQKFDFMKWFPTCTAVPEYIRYQFSPKVRENVSLRHVKKLDGLVQRFLRDGGPRFKDSNVLVIGEIVEPVVAALQIEDQGSIDGVLRRSIWVYPELASLDTPQFRDDLSENGISYIVCLRKGIQPVRDLSVILNKIDFQGVVIGTLYVPTQEEKLELDVLATRNKGNVIILSESGEP